MKIKVLFFAHLKELLAEAELDVEIESGASIQHLCDRLAARGDVWVSVFGQPNQQLKVACNQQLSSLNTLLKDNDEVAFFPPVTGG